MDRVLVILIGGDLLPADITVEVLVLLGDLVLPPGIFPCRYRLVGDRKYSGMSADRSKERVHKGNNIFRRAVGDLELPLEDPLVGSQVVTVEDFKEESGVTSSPRVDRLLGVTHVEERPLPSAVLDHLVDEGTEHLPLDPAGVLELIEEPVIELRIEPVSCARHPVQTADLLGEKIGHIREGHLPAAACERVVGILKRLHEAVKRRALLKQCLVDRLEKRMQ